MSTTAAAGVRRPSDTALIQFTSGSSGRARGIPVPASALAANLRAIHRWLDMTHHDTTASWLPVHHDMGLIGCLLAPTVVQADIWLMQPEHFLRSPRRYLECFGSRGAALSAMPTFGLEYIARRVKPDHLRDMDFSGWRALVVGAERVDADVLDAFTSLLAPRGFRRRTLAPAYGLAEATLAVTGVPLDEEPVVTHDPSTGQTLVGCGEPLAGVEVVIEREDGTPAADGELGEIVVRGPSVTAGYVGDTSSPSLTRFERGALNTGDCGFLRAGQVHVVGRIGDSVKVRGRAVFAEDVEAVLRSAGIPALRAAVLLGHVGEAPTAVALLEQPTDEWVVSARAALRRRVDTAEVIVVSAPRRAIARTSSGKPRRRVLWQSFLDGSLPGTVN